MTLPSLLAGVKSIYSNALREAGVTCDVCAAPVAAPYTVCYPCNSHARSGKQIADIVAPLSYALKGSQSMTDLYNYKEVSLASGVRESARDRLLTMLYESLSRHLPCLVNAGGPMIAVTTVPSSSRTRLGPHPLEEMLLAFGEGFPRIAIEYVGPGGDRSIRRVLDPSHFAILSGAIPRETHVLLIDDAWVSGVHAQSVAGTLKANGARWVSTVPLARVLSPSFDVTKNFLASRTLGAFNPDVCPLSGRVH
jgi:hypothetical protein